MATKKIPISFNDHDQINLKELIDLLNYTDTYGDNPKAIKFGIKLALSTFKNPHKVYAGLNGDDLDLYFQSIAKAEKRRRMLETAQNLTKQSKKV